MIISPLFIYLGLVNLFTREKGSDGARLWELDGLIEWEKEHPSEMIRGPRGIIVRLITDSGMPRKTIEPDEREHSEDKSLVVIDELSQCAGRDVTPYEGVEWLDDIKFCGDKDFPELVDYFDFLSDYHYDEEDKEDPVLRVYGNTLHLSTPVGDYSVRRLGPGRVEIRRIKEILKLVVDRPAPGEEQPSHFPKQFFLQAKKYEQDNADFDGGSREKKFISTCGNSGIGKNVRLLDLRKVKESLGALNIVSNIPQAAFEAESDMLLEAYRYVNMRLDSVEPLRAEDLLEINLLLTVGGNRFVYPYYRQFISRTRGSFSRSIGPVWEWYRRHESSPPVEKAAGLAARMMLSQPNLFEDGNHRSAAVVMALILLKEGNAPFIPNKSNIKALLSITGAIQSLKRDSFVHILPLLIYQGRLGRFLDNNTSEAFLIPEYGSSRDEGANILWDGGDNDRCPILNEVFLAALDTVDESGNTIAYNGLVLIDREAIEFLRQDPGSYRIGMDCGGPQFKPLSKKEDDLVINISEIGCIRISSETVKWLMFVKRKILVSRDAASKKLKTSFVRADDCSDGGVLELSFAIGARGRRMCVDSACCFLKPGPEGEILRHPEIVERLREIYGYSSKIVRKEAIIGFFPYKIDPAARYEKESVINWEEYHCACSALQILFDYPAGKGFTLYGQCSIWDKQPDLCSQYPGRKEMCIYEEFLYFGLDFHYLLERSVVREENVVSNLSAIPEGRGGIYFTRNAFMELESLASETTVYSFSEIRGEFFIFEPAHEKDVSIYPHNSLSDGGEEKAVLKGLLFGKDGKNILIPLDGNEEKNFDRLAEYLKTAWNIPDLRVYDEEHNALFYNYIDSLLFGGQEMYNPEKENLAADTFRTRELGNISVSIFGDFMLAGLLSQWVESIRENDEFTFEAFVRDISVYFRLNECPELSGKFEYPRIVSPQASGIPLNKYRDFELGNDPKGRIWMICSWNTLPRHWLDGRIPEFWRLAMVEDGKETVLYSKESALPGEEVREAFLSFLGDYLIIIKNTCLQVLRLDTKTLIMEITRFSAADGGQKEKYQLLLKARENPYVSTKYVTRGLTLADAYFQKHRDYFEGSIVDHLEQINMKDAGGKKVLLVGVGAGVIVKDIRDAFPSLELDFINKEKIVIPRWEFPGNMRFKDPEHKKKELYDFLDYFRSGITICDIDRGLPFDDGIFSGVIVANSVEEYIKDKENLFGEVKRVLAPDAAAFFSTLSGFRIDGQRTDDFFAMLGNEYRYRAYCSSGKEGCLKVTNSHPRKPFPPLELVKRKSAKAFIDIAESPEVFTCYYRLQEQPWDSARGYADGGMADQLCLDCKRVNFNGTIITRSRCVDGACCFFKTNEAGISLSYPADWISRSESAIVFSIFDKAQGDPVFSLETAFPCPGLQIVFEYSGTGGLSLSTRCSIYEYRPDICRVFPRLKEKGRCPYENLMLRAIPFRYALSMEVFNDPNIISGFKDLESAYGGVYFTSKAEEMLRARVATARGEHIPGGDGRYVLFSPVGDKNVNFSDGGEYEIEAERKADSIRRILQDNGFSGVQEIKVLRGLFCKSFDEVLVARADACQGGVIRQLIIKDCRDYSYETFVPALLERFGFKSQRLITVAKGYMILEYARGMTLDEFYSSNAKALALRPYCLGFSSGLGEAALASFLVGLGDRKPDNLVMTSVPGEIPARIVNIDNTSAFAIRDPGDFFEQKRMFADFIAAAGIAGSLHKESLAEYRRAFWQAMELKLSEVRRGEGLVRGSDDISYLRPYKWAYDKIKKADGLIKEFADGGKETRREVPRDLEAAIIGFDGVV
ncbi:MAG: hypothetical protein WC354_06800, partial [Candidatus Omnitrophota bacterium]